jgi:hypothetical protein
MRHQPFEPEARAGDRLLRGIAERESRDDGRADHWRRRLERPADTDGVSGIGRARGAAAAPGETRQAAEDE